MQRLLKTLSLFLIICISAVSYTALNNILIVCTIAKGFDVPSRAHYLLLERAINLTEKKSNCERLVSFLENGSQKHLHSMFIYLLGLKGDNKLDLLLIHLSNTNSKENSDIANSAINAMGMSGNKIFSHNLLKKIDNNKNNSYRLYLLTRAYFLITGNDFYFSGKQKKYINLEESFFIFREIVLSSIDRERTSAEMISLDRLSRPPGY